MYLDFNVAIKKIKLRETLRAIMGAPDVYLRSKVPEDMYHILQQFAEIRKLTRLHLVRNFNLFPETENLLTLERKYGDSLNFEDMNGKPGKKGKKKAEGENASSYAPGQTATDAGKSGAFGMSNNDPAATNKTRDTHLTQGTQKSGTTQMNATATSAGTHKNATATSIGTKN